MSSQPSNSGIVTDSTGERHIPESTRADGSVRKAIKIRPGYKPPEDAEIYKNRTAETFRNRYKGGVIGAEAAAPSPAAQQQQQQANTASSAAANKNAKRREARKKAKAAGEKAEQQEGGEGGEGGGGGGKEDKDGAQEGGDGPAVDPDVERKKKARNLTKKLKQAKELKSKKDDGQSLLPEQFAKVIKINELVRELAALGFDAEGEPIGDTEAKTEDGKNEAKKDEAPA